MAGPSSSLFFMKFALALLAFVVVALVVPFLIPGAGRQQGSDPETNLPWQIEVDAQGNSHVFGLVPGGSTLGQVRERFGADVEIAIIATPDEVGSLEAYYNQVSLGFLLARIIVTVDASPEVVTAMRERALKAQYMESATRKIRLHPDDLAAADQLPIRALSVIPSINLDEAAVLQRFGPAAERLQVSERRVHLLYPAKGLDVILDQDGKELLQYVAPRNFALLREPLKAGMVVSRGGK